MDIMYGFIGFGLSVCLMFVGLGIYVYLINKSEEKE